MCENIFYIDDNEYEHLIVENLIKTYTECKKVSLFLKGKDAMDFLEKNKSNPNELPDLILLDLFMPDFSGWDFLAEFTGLYPALSKQIKVIILSSSVSGEDIERSKNYPFVKTYLSKPLTQAMLKDFN